MAEISVIGAGYVGLVSGACLAELGHTVTCVETDGMRLFQLEQGEIPIYEPGLEEIVSRNVAAARLRFTGDYAEAIPTSQFVFIAVGTPPRPDGHADTSYVFGAVQLILMHARQRLTIVTKSTVPVGTGDAIAEMVGKSPGRGIDVVSNPEFLREGTAVQDFMEPDRIVVGAANIGAADAVAHLYAKLDAPVIVCSRRSAELAKYAANALLATRISFINEVSAICDAVGADIDDVARIAGADSRIGPAFLRAGLGWGGSCFPKDVRALSSTAISHGCRTSILDAVFDVNERQRERAAEILVSAVDGIKGGTVGVLGLAFKPDTDDIRSAPVIEIIQRLTGRGIKIRAHDPAAMDNARERFPQVTFCDDPYEAARGSHALLVATEWEEYKTLTWERIRSLMHGSVVLDGRNVLNPNLLSSLGFAYRSFGRCSPNNGDPQDQAIGGRLSVAAQ